MGMVYNPFDSEYRLISGNVDVNYLVSCKR